MAVSSDRVEVNANRSFQIVGNAYDINRVLQACRNAMIEIEHKRYDPLHVVTVVIPDPDPTSEVGRRV